MSKVCLTKEYIKPGAIYWLSSSDVGYMIISCDDTSVTVASLRNLGFIVTVDMGVILNNPTRRYMDEDWLKNQNFKKDLKDLLE